MYVRVHAPHILLYSTLDSLLSPPALPPPTYSPHTEEEVRTAPLLLLCLGLLLQQLLLSRSHSLWVPVKYMLLALIVHSIIQVVLPPSSRSSLHTQAKIHSVSAHFPSRSLALNLVLYPLSWERGLVSRVLLSPTPAVLNHPFINS